MPKKPAATAAFRDVVAALSKPTRSRHSSAYLWLRRNRQQVERQIADHGINWQDFAAALATAGIVNRKGEPFSGAALKQTWFRLRQDILKQPPARQGRPPIPAARGREIAHGVVSVVGEEPEADGLPARPRRFAPASLRGHTPALPPDDKPEPPPAPARQDPDEVVARLLGRKRASKPQSD